MANSFPNQNIKGMMNIPIWSCPFSNLLIWKSLNHIQTAVLRNLYYLFQRHSLLWSWQLLQGLWLFDSHDRILRKISKTEPDYFRDSEIKQLRVPEGLPKGTRSILQNSSIHSCRHPPLTTYNKWTPHPFVLMTQLVFQTLRLAASPCCFCFHTAFLKL